MNRASSYTCTCKVCGGGGGGVAVDGTQPTYYNGADYILHWDMDMVAEGRDIIGTVIAS